MLNFHFMDLYAVKNFLSIIIHLFLSVQLFYSLHRSNKVWRNCGLDG
jgi:hypothetical protein